MPLSPPALNEVDSLPIDGSTGSSNRKHQCCGLNTVKNTLFLAIRPMCPVSSALYFTSHRDEGGKLGWYCKNPVHLFPLSASRCPPLSAEGREGET